jgi:hypothetical protein
MAFGADARPPFDRCGIRVERTPERRASRSTAIARLGSERLGSIRLLAH